MSTLTQLKKHLKQGQVYRRSDLVPLSGSVDRHLGELVQEGMLQKLSQGMYYFPKESAFGKTPPDEQVLVRSFLQDNEFLVTSPNSFNSLGLGMTQLYNERIVYNHKRHGKFTFGNQNFDFRIRPRFPRKVTKEFLLVDLVNNLDMLAEDRTEVLKNVSAKVASMDKTKLKQSVAKYGDVQTKKIFAPLM